MNDLTKTDLNKLEVKNSQNNPRFDLSYFPQTDVLENSLNKMFPEQAHEDKTVQRAKEILGDKFTTEEVKFTIASFEYIIRAWLEEYEKKVFNKTLKELLQDL